MNTKRKIATLLIIAALFAPFLLLRNVAAQDDPVIVLDMSHGQYKSSIWETEDARLERNLTAMGYEVVWAQGGLNSTILADADALIIGSIWSPGFTTSEVNAVADWYGAGKFLWVATDSDYAGPNINHNATLILEAVNSHVYGEEGDIKDLESNAGGDYRPVANVTTTEAHLADIVDGVTKVLCHGPTSLVGSTSGTFDSGIVALEDTTVPNVWPVLWYSPAATIADNDDVPPLVHTVGDAGSWVAMTVEYNAGGIIAVSGASPYGDYQPMYTGSYYGFELDGYNLVKNVIEWGLSPDPQPGVALDPMLLIAIGGGAVVVIIIIVILMKRK
jgi:hypothetical protein